MIEEGSDLWNCAVQVERSDPERFATVMAAPVAARAVLFPIYAFNAEVSRAPWVTAEPMIAEMRLQWWRDVLDEIATGGPVRRHEVATPLAALLDKEACAVLDALIEARRADIERAPFGDEAALWAYLEATGGGLMTVSARALGEPYGRRAQAAGTALALANYLRAVPELEARGKLPLPDGRPEALRALAQRGLDLLQQARRAPGVSGTARAALMPASIAGAMLRRVRARPAHVADGTVMPPEAAVRWARLRASLRGGF
ncbi:squalene/phytoene synthase family protein [Sagittula sp. SSi028]|uniref:squalene/phytoene synthase family protein n=1 Tax=Sagittula sp. SSi028 TaxID=3400636 RepID=UPI003AF9F996